MKIKLKSVLKFKKFKMSNHSYKKYYSQKFIFIIKVVEELRVIFFNKKINLKNKEKYSEN